MMKHVFIVNPTSGSGKYRDALALIEEYFYESELDYEIRKTEYVKHATEIAEEYSGDVILYSVGGDGTAHEILNGIQEDVQMAIIPVGTGNDFWRMVDFKGSLRDILYQTIDGKIEEIDIGLANGHRFLNCANIGFDAEVNLLVNGRPHKFIPRKLVYLFAALRVLVRYKSIDIEIDLDGEKFHQKTFLSSFMNGKWYGGGFKSAPKASLTDRKLDVCLVKDLSLSQVLPVIPKYYKGTHLDIDEVIYRQVSKVKIKSNDKIIIGSDGELFKFDEIEIELDPMRLKLRLPQKAELRQGSYH